MSSGQSLPRESAWEEGESADKPGEDKLARGRRKKAM